jgi:cytochrome c553
MSDLQATSDQNFRTATIPVFVFNLLEKSMYKKIALAFAGFALSGMAGAVDVHTRTIASTCMTCHGPGGKSLGVIPSLAGLEKDRFVKLVQEFKSGARPASIMKRHASGYTDAEIEAVGDYFASLK